MSTDGGDGEDHGRGWNTFAAVFAVVAIIGLGIWLMNEFFESEKYARCAESRRRNCDTIDYRSAPPASQQ
jgi:hypothetical protein